MKKDNMKNYTKDIKSSLPKQSEQSLVKEIIYLLNISGHFVWRNNSGAFRDKNRFIRFGYKGSPDIIGVSKGGRFIGIECKIGKNKPTQFQENFLNEIKDHGGIAIVAYSIDDIYTSDLFDLTDLPF
jgi:hypothetical protein